MAIYMANMPVMPATMIGTHMRAAETLSIRSVMVCLMNESIRAAAIPPSTGEITQLAAIVPMTGQATLLMPAAATPAPT